MIQKRAIKWISGRQFDHMSSEELYEKEKNEVDEEGDEGAENDMTKKRKRSLVKKKDDGLCENEGCSIE